ncbi:Crp/Fnr family transcriptional regulator [Capnocytophaga sp. ARDL2]|uniref:Crp/Fnr family transcriptional regulator n=1 Tax=Capnocytophaga sp. ARDL2 TaxID=3238809 RepID=UPI0035589BC6
MNTNKCEHCLIRELSSLRALTREDLLQLSKCKESYLVRKGETIFEEGHALKGIYCIKNGVCKLVKMNAQGKNVILKLTKGGDLLGQNAIFSNENSHLSAIAIEDMSVCFIPKTDLLKFFESNPRFSMEMTKELCNQLKSAEDFAISHTHKTVKERLANTLLEMKNIKGYDREGFISLQLSRDDIASYVGTATESCIRLLSELKKEGVIELSGKKIKIIDEKKLIQIAEE